MRQEARYVHRHHQRQTVKPWYRLSVWTDVARHDETRLDLMQRLVHAAGLGRIRLDDERNSVFWWAEAGDIYDAGFTFAKDIKHDEPYEHYSVDLGEDPTTEVVAKFAGLFVGPEATGGMT